MSYKNLFTVYDKHVTDISPSFVERLFPGIFSSHFVSKKKKILILERKYGITDLLYNNNYASRTVHLY